MAWFLLKDLLRLATFFILWIVGCMAILVLLKTKKIKKAGTRYSLISMIGILFLAIMTIRLLKSNLTAKVITLKKFSGRWFKGSKKNPKSKDIHYFKDVDDKVINLKNVLKKRQICLFSIVDSVILQKELLKIADNDDIDYYHIDLNIAFNRFYTKKTLESFWSQFAIALIKKLSANPDSKKTIIFLWTLEVNSYRKEVSTLSYSKKVKRDDEEKYKIDSFVEIIQTLTLNLRNFNILMITESDQLLYYLKGTPLTRIMTVYKLTSHKLKLDSSGIPYRNVKINKNNEKQLDFEEEILKEKIISEKERKRDKKWAKYSKLKTKEEREAQMLKDAKKLEEDFIEAKYKRDRKIRDFKVSLSDRHNKEVILSVLKGSKTIGKNEWVAINQIAGFSKMENRFNYLVDRRIFERSGNLVRFINQDVFLYYSYELIGNMGDAIEQNLEKISKSSKKRKKKRRRRKKQRSWLVRFLWDLD